MSKEDNIFLYLYRGTTKYGLYFDQFGNKTSSTFIFVFPPFFSIISFI